MDSKDFVHLHTHTYYSLLQALPSPKALVSHVKEQGMSAVAITDNGGLHGAVEFYKACKAKEITPIIGIDMYLAQHRMTDKRPRIDDRPYRLPLIALNKQGYQNLLKITTAGYLDGFYYKPRVDKEFLQDHAKGLVAFSGALNGEIPMALSMSDYEKAAKLVEEYKKIFGKDNFYLELIHHPDFGRQVDMNEAIKKLALQTKTQLVATKNLFYLDPDDRDGYEAQLCIMRGRTIEDFRRTSTEDVDLSIGNPEEIIEYFKDVPEACENTRKIADRVNFEMDLGNNYLPIFPMPEGKTDEDYLHELSLKGLKMRYGDDLSDEIMERFEYEFGVIKGMGFPSYFIIVQDFVVWAKDQGILVGPGRGSAAGSIISYALRITDIDPLKYGLLFERFLNPDRVSLPDVDLDFADNRRGEVLDYVKKQYGEDKVAGIITFGTLKPKAAVRDAARVLGLSFAEGDVIAKAIPDPLQGKYTPLAKSIEEDPELSMIYKNDSIARRVINLAIKLEGNPRHASQHACGIVIGDKPLVERVPVQKGQREDMEYVTQFSLNSAEAAGLVKMDFLGLSNLTVIQDALEIIKAVHDVEVDIDTIPLDDKKTFELLGRGETTGVFQLESGGMKRYIRSLKPTQFEDIVAMVSLYRPGPMQFIDSFIRRKYGKEKIVYEHPLMKNAFKETYGIPVYQEQVMQVAKDMAGFSGGQADTLRKAMGKKIAELMAKMKVLFVEGAMKNGVSNKVAEKVFKKLEDFAAYGFNKSHAACYAMIAYRTAYLKAHYTPEFMAALMNSDINTIDRITIEVEECDRLGMKVLAPDVNESFPGFAVVPETGNIRWGLAAIKNFGEEAAKAVTRERKENGLYEDLADFATRVEGKYFNKKSLDALIKSGALDRFENRSTLVANMDQLLQFNKQAMRDRDQNQVSMFDLAPEMSESKLSLRKVKPISESQLLGWEKELLGLYISSHPASLFSKKFQGHVTRTAEAVKGEDGMSVKIAGVVTSIKKILTKKKQQPMAFVRVEDMDGAIELVVFPKLYSKVRDLLVEDTYVLVQGKVSVRERGDVEERSVLCDEIVKFTDKDIDEVQVMLARGGWNTDGFGAEEEDLIQSGITIRMPEKPDHDMIDKLREVFKASPGHEPIYLLVESGGKSSHISTEYSIEKSRNVLSKIAEIVGKDSIIV